MMQDRHENGLAAYYKKTLERVRADLVSDYTVEGEFDSDKDVDHVSGLNLGSVVWRIAVPGKEQLSALLVAIPPTFPDSFPRFYLTEADYFKFGDLPHIDKNRFVCTRDPAVVVLNDACPERAFRELFTIAVGIVEAGTKGCSEQDFKDEFLAYWNDAAQHQAIMTCPVPQTPSLLDMCEVVPAVCGASHLIASSKAEALSWVARLGVRTNIARVEKALCLELPEIPDSVPKTNHDVKAIIDDLGKDGAQSVRSLHVWSVLGCIPLRGDIMLVLWQHPLVEVRGFRKRRGAVPLYLRVSNPDGEDVSIQRWRVRRFDRIRVVRRAVDMNTIDNDGVRLAIVGCGSVGSVLSMLLEKSGCGRFTLIDPEELTEDNIARHLCGCRAVATTPRKVEAVKNALESHLPSVDCRVYDRDILDVLMSTPQIVEDADLVIVATGNMAAERRINDVFVGDMRRPVIYLWLEPYGVAGHMLYISPDHGGCYRCCFAEDGQFLFSVAQDGHLFARREAGCQQTFTPYGVADLTMFCAAACKEIIRIIRESQNQSTLITWIGDLEQFQSAGHAIKDDYRAHTSYSIHRREISKRNTCVSCRNRG